MPFESLVMPRKVLMTADTIGGVWTYALELAAALGKYGIEVALATMGAPLTPQQRETSRQIPNLEVFESNFKLEWMEDPWEDVKQAGEWLLQLEGHLQPDIVHLNGYVHAALSWQAPTLVVGHSCVLSWWEAVKGEPAPASWNRYQQNVRQGLQAANLVVAPSAAMLTALISHYGELVNSKVIPNGRDPAVFYPSVKKEFVLTAGRLWDEAKNVAVLEDIAPQLLWSIYIAGEQKHPDGGIDAMNRVSITQLHQAVSPQPNPLLNKGRELTSPLGKGGLRGVKPIVGYPVQDLSTSNVHRLGRLSTEELATWYAQASIYALPARYEPFGLSVLEAALSGCALVLGDIPSLREIWRDAAVFVPPDQKNAIVHAINTLSRDSSVRTAFATKARTRALEFTPQRMVTGYLEAYQDLIEQRCKGTICRVPTNS
ncbi:MAG TPA: glycosyltransferase family 4 protein [Coleofasciculaceae cyanobacterium]|jgi:glycosyltransferase involved in cell wall biosynthesis